MLHSLMYVKEINKYIKKTCPNYCVRTQKVVSLQRVRENTFFIG